MEKKALFDQVVEYYARHRVTPGNISQDELNDIIETFKDRVSKDAIPRIEQEELKKAKARVDEEVKAYKRQAFQNLKRSLIIEAILVAFLVGIIVNQVTNIIPKGYHWIVIIVSLIICVLLIILGTAEPKE